MSTLFGRVVDGSTGVSVTVTTVLPVPTVFSVEVAVVLLVPVAAVLVVAVLLVPVVEAVVLMVLPVPAAALPVLAAELPVPAVFSEAVAVLPVPAVLSEVFVLLVVLLFPTSSALLTIGVASSVPLMTSVTSFRDIFFFFILSPSLFFSFSLRQELCSTL